MWKIGASTLALVTRAHRFRVLLVALAGWLALMGALTAGGAPAEQVQFQVQVQIVGNVGEELASVCGADVTGPVLGVVEIVGVDIAGVFAP